MRYFLVLSFWLLMLPCGNMPPQPDLEEHSAGNYQTQAKDKILHETLPQPSLAQGKPDSRAGRPERIKFQQPTATLDPLYKLTSLLQPEHRLQPIKPGQPDFRLPDELQPVVLFLDFENDIFAGTDYYYTNGVTIGISAPWLSPVKKTRLFPALGNEAMNIYSLSLTQKMFTGLNPETTEPPQGDHPFSGLLYTELSQSSMLPEKGLMLRSSLNLGFTGPLSLAGKVQQWMHNLEPKGWEYQNKNSILINYNILLDQTIHKSRSGQMGLGMELRAGNLETMATAYFRTVFNLISLGEGSGLQLFSSANLSLVLHKASLRGGIVANESPYMISFENLERFTAEMSGGLMLQTRGTGVGLKMVYLSPEFRGGRSHAWGAIRLTQNLLN